MKSQAFKKNKLSHNTPMKAQEGRGVIAPTHSRPPHYMGWVVSVTSRLSFTPGERTPRYPLCRRLGGTTEPVWTQRLEEKSYCLCRGSNLDHPVCSQTLYWLSYSESVTSIYPYLMLINTCVVNLLKFMYHKLRKNSDQMNNNTRNWQVNCSVWNKFIKFREMAELTDLIGVA
jgi:hypothetical protein